jgi:hypothetical protein
MVAGHAERLGGLQLNHVMGWPEVPGIPRALARMEDLPGRRAGSGHHRPKIRRSPSLGPRLVRNVSDHQQRTRKSATRRNDQGQIVAEVRFHVT